MANDHVRLIAFYLPQYHPIPENDSWWGKGFTEWTSVVKAKPLFPGHYQPHLPADLGFYDLRLPEVRQAQADLAREYGIYGFCYYHYWFNGKRLLERPFDEVLASGQPDFPFCLCWANENWTRAWDGLEHRILIGQKYSFEDDRQHIRWLTSAFRDKRYIRINGKPLFLVYRASKIPNPLKTTSIWREEARKTGVGELYLCCVESLPGERGDPTQIGFDAAVEFQPDWMNLGTPLRDGIHRAYEDNHIEDYAATVERMLQKRPPPYKRFPCVTSGWDNTPRRRKNVYIFRDSTPELYERWLKAVIEKFVPSSRDENLVFINAWNEWGEGAHLEPCQKWGRAYLEATRRAIQGREDTFALHDSGSIESDRSESPLLEVCAQDRGDTLTLEGSRLVKPDRRDSPPVRVSVCIPTYNGAQYVGEAIASVLRQTFTDLELIVVDDCSTDSTEAVVTSFSDSRLKYFKNPARLGLVGNWNKCCELSTGKYVYLFHQDDVMLAENLERKIKLLEENPDAGLVYSNVFIINAKGNVVSKHWFFKTEPEKDFVSSGLSFFEILLSGSNIVCCPSVMVRRECYEKLGGFDSRLPFTADWEMWMRIALFYDVAYLAKPLVRFRWHGGNESLNFQGLFELRQYYECKKIVLEKYPERIPNSQALRAMIAEDHAEQAFDRAIYHYRHQQLDEANEYLAFALDVQATTIGHYDEYVHWLLGAIDRAWQHPERQLFFDISGEEISQRIPMRNIIIAMCFKIAAQPGFRWLRHFRGLGERLLIR